MSKEAVEAPDPDRRLLCVRQNSRAKTQRRKEERAVRHKKLARHHTCLRISRMMGIVRRQWPSRGDGVCVFICAICGKKNASTPRRTEMYIALPYPVKPGNSIFQMSKKQQAASNFARKFTSEHQPPGYAAFEEQILNLRLHEIRSFRSVDYFENWLLVK